MDTDLIDAFPHPLLPVVIMQNIDDTVEERVWVAEAATRTIIWRLEGAQYMAWLRGGTEIGVIASTFTPDPSKPDIIASSLQSEFTYQFQRWTWPGMQLISSCPISMRTGWPTALLPTPDPNFVMFEWYDQGEAGYEGIQLDDQHGDAQEKRESYEIGMPRLAHDLPIIFSPDARYLVRCHSTTLPESMHDDWEHTLNIAYLTIIDRQIPTIHDIPLAATIPPGWSMPESYRQTLPAERKSRAYWEALSWVQSYTFADATHVVLSCFDGTSYRIDITTASLANLPSMPDYLPLSRESPQIDKETLRRLMLENMHEYNPPARPVPHPHDDAYIVAADRSAKKQKQWIARNDGQVIWDMDDVLRLVWLRNGQEVAMLRGEPYIYGKKQDQHIVLERRSWPDLTLLSQLPLIDWAGEPYSMVAVPHDAGVVVLWNTQEIENERLLAFLYRIQIGKRDEQDTILTRALAKIEDVVAQNADGTRLLCLQSDGMAWPAHAAMFHGQRQMIMGWATLFDWQAHQAREIALCADFPANWQPPDLAQRRSPLLPYFVQTHIAFVEDAVFLDDRLISFRFATKESITLAVDEENPNDHA